MRVVFELRPAPASTERFYELYFGFAQEGRVNAKAMPGLLDLATVWAQTSDCRPNLASLPEGTTSSGILPRTLPQRALQSRAMNPSHGAPFRGFRDDEESPFFCAAGRTPEETWDVSVNRFADILETLEALADAGPIEMSPALLCSWHREIFGELFPDRAGRLRGFRDGQAEHVYFSVHDRGYRGTTPRELRRRLEKICTEFNTTAAAICVSDTADTFDAVHAATRLYAKVLRAHPFVDGNLRGTTVALNAGLVTLGLDIVGFKDLARHDELLGIAFVGRNDPYRPLAEHIAELVGDTGTP